MDDSPVLKRMKVGPKLTPMKHVTFKDPQDDKEYRPHVIKIGLQYDTEMLNQVCQKYKKMGHTVQMQNRLIKLNCINASVCLQEEINKSFMDNMDLTDMTLVSADGQEIPCHRFILAVRSPVFKKLFSGQKASEELREAIDASTDALKAMMKYLYTDTVDNDDITEDLMNLADKYELAQLKELCIPYLIKKVNFCITYPYILIIFPLFLYINLSTQFLISRSMLTTA